MQELKLEEMEQVNGGWVPLAVLVAEGVVAGVGAVAGYNLAKFIRGLF